MQQWSRPVTVRGQDSSGQISAQFCPPPQGQVEGWLDHITVIGGDLIELDGRRLPRVREPTREPWATRAAYERIEFDPDTPSAKLAALVLELETIKAVEGNAPRQPGRNLRFCLEAAYMDRIEATSLGKIGDYLGLAPQPDRRNVRRIIVRGEALWAALGAWPWAVYPDAPLAPNWRLDPLVARALESWHERAAAEAGMRVRRDAARLRRARRALQPGSGT
jgi:hypothetical protein